MSHNKNKHMFGSKRALAVTNPEDQPLNQSDIVIPASGQFDQDSLQKNHPDLPKKFYTEKELAPVMGHWNVKQSSSSLESSLADYLSHSDQSHEQQKVLSPPQKPSMSSKDLKLQSGIYHDYTLSNHFDFSPALEETDQKLTTNDYLDNFTDKEASYNMSYLPEESQAIPGIKGYASTVHLIGKIFSYAIIIASLPFLALGGLYLLQGSQGEQWIMAKNQVKNIVQYAQGSKQSIFSNQNSTVHSDLPHQRISTSHTSGSRSINKPYNVTINTDQIKRKPNSNNFAIALMIKTATQNTSPDQLVKISGLPNNAALSKGNYMSAGVWMVTMKDLKTLTMQVTGKLSRDINLKASFIQDSGQIVELASYTIPQGFQPNTTKLTKSETSRSNHKQDFASNRTRHMTLSSRHSANTVAQQTKSGLPKQNPALDKGIAKAARKSETAPIRIHPVYEQQQLNRASIYLAKSDFTTAREILEKAANAGSARAATALARSYDPKFLIKISVRGIKPDLKKAKYWYTKAVRLGNAGVLQRLGQLK